MAFGSTDLIAVDRSTTTYKETYGNKANIDKSDYLMVEATATTGGRVIGDKYRCYRYDLDGGGSGATGPNSASTPINSDLLLVERPSATLNMTAVLGATTLYVNAIPAALSSGTRLLFDGSAGSAEFVLTSSASAGATTLTGTGGLKGSQVNSYTVGGVLYKATTADWVSSGSYADIHSANYAINPITTLYGQTSNNSKPYSVAEVQIEVSSSASYAAGDLYIGFRNTAGTAWQGDLPIAAIQILHANGTTVRQTTYHDCTWNFALGNTQAGYFDWGTSTATITNISTSPASASYSSIGTSATVRRFSYTTSGTGSSWVGALRGVPSSTYTGNPGTTSILPVGSANVSQSSSSSDGYLFSECSGSSTNNVTWLILTTTGNIYNGDRIRICYFGGGNGQTSSSGLQTTNSLYLRFV